MESELQYDVETVKVYLTDKEQAYAVFEEPSQEILVLVSESKTTEDPLQNNSAILRHIERHLVEVSGVAVKGVKPEVKNFLDWPSELQALIIQAYYKAIGTQSSSSKLEETEKN